MRTGEIFRERVRGGDRGGGKGRERNAGVGGLCPAHCALRTPYTVHRTCTYVSAHSVVRRSVRILVSAVRRARRQEASSRALLCTAQLRPGDGSDVIGSGPTHTNKLALTTQTFNNS